MLLNAKRSAAKVGIKAKMLILLAAGRYIIKRPEKPIIVAIQHFLLTFSLRQKAARGNIKRDSEKRIVVFSANGMTLTLKQHNPRATAPKIPLITCWA